MSFRGTTTEQSRKVSGQSEDEILKKLQTRDKNLEALFNSLAKIGACVF